MVNGIFLEQAANEAIKQIKQIFAQWQWATEANIPVEPGGAAIALGWCVATHS